MILWHFQLTTCVDFSKVQGDRDLEKRPYITMSAYNLVISVGFPNAPLRRVVKIFPSSTYLTIYTAESVREPRNFRSTAFALTSLK